MKRAAASCRAVLLMVVGTVSVVAQAPDFSGTWKLDRQRSEINPAAGLAGLMSAGIPDTLHVTHAANGTVAVESQINEGHVRFYVAGKSTTPAGQGGTITMMSRWDGRMLISEGTQETASGTTTLVKQVKEVIALTADGRALTIEVTTTAVDEKAASKLTFTRTQNVGPCTSWPTPCKFGQ